MKNTVYITWALIAGIGAVLYYFLVNQEPATASTSVVLTSPAESSSTGEAETWLGQIVDEYQAKMPDEASGASIFVDVFQAMWQNR